MVVLISPFAVFNRTRISPTAKLYSSMSPPARAGATITPQHHGGEDDGHHGVKIAEDGRRLHADMGNAAEVHPVGDARVNDAHEEQHADIQSAHRKGNTFIMKMQ